MDRPTRPTRTTRQIKLKGALGNIFFCICVNVYLRKTTGVSSTPRSENIPRGQENYL